MDREYLGSITMSTGSVYKVYMPTVGDIIDSGIDSQTVEGTHMMCALAIGMPFDVFRKLSINDGGRVAEKLVNALETFNMLGRKPTP